MIDHVYILFLCMIVAMCAARINRDGQNVCKEVTDAALEEILGAAFNARYMSVEMPSIERSDNNNNNKRKIGYDLDFYVDGRFEEDFDERPAWTVTNHIEDTRNQYGDSRYRRDAEFLQEWHCRSHVVWTDLGPDYFPRYLRSVECLTESCWFNIYKCRQRAFTVKLLKRRPERCVRVTPGAAASTGVAGLPRELRELWVWEERAVSFCCDCAP